MSLSQLKRVRWAVRATLGLGILASTAANVLHAQPNPVSRVIAGWPPVALFIALELISKVPTGQRHRAVAKAVATGVIAGIAAWVSYWHMAAVASRYGETGASPYLLPLSVDGLIVVATICLVELADRIRMATGGPVVTEQPAAVAEVASGHVATVAVATSPPLATVATAARGGHDAPPPVATTSTRPVATGRDATAAAIAALRRDEPALTQQDVATRLAMGKRTVVRYWSTTTPPANGRVPQLTGAPE